MNRESQDDLILSVLRQFSFSKPVKAEELEKAYAAGMIKKENLKDGQYYLGHCRNARVALWSSELNQFVYRRYKFGDFLTETIMHPADDDQFDLFVPVAEIEPEDKEKVDLP